MRVVGVYFATLVVFLGMDFVWLSSMLGRLYKPALGEFLAEKPNFPAAGVFYALYAVGIVALAVMPAREVGVLRATWMGALLGLVAYGTYDLTNMATLRNWSTTLTVADMAWGTVATAVAATVGCVVARSLIGR